MLVPSTRFALVAAALFASASAHSWIEELSVIANNGTMVGAPGYPRGFVKRAAGVDPDKGMVNLIPPNGRPTGNKILDSDPICMPSQQHQTQTDGSPMLNAAPGDMVMLRYQENGHVTLPQNQPGKPQNRGTVYIYGTSNPSPGDKLLSIHKVWNPEGTGGDKRGKLLATEPFDDGQCYQLNGGQISTQRQAQFKHPGDVIMGQDLWCQNNFKIPTDASTGKPYTVYWVWDWPTAKGTPGQPQGLNEIYTTCSDIKLTGAQTSGKSQGGAAKFLAGQNLNFAGIPSYVDKLGAGSSLFVPGSVSSEPAAAAPAASAATPQSSQPAATHAPQSPLPSKGVAGAGQMTVTVTATPSAKTVTVTAAGQVSQTPSTTVMTTHPTIYITQSAHKTIGASAPTSLVTASPQSGISPVTVSGVVIPTMSVGTKFSGTASAVSPAGQTGSPAAQNGSPAAYGKVCASCKPQKRSTIFNRSVQKFKNPGSAKFRAV